MACEEYDDGSWFCEDANGWQYQDASGNYSDGYYGQDGEPINRNGLAVTIADAVSSVFGGGQRGYYAPNRGGNQYPGGGYPNSYGQGFNAGGSIGRGGAGAGFNISTNTLMLIAGGVLIYILGQKKGR